jgi:hypothetical protein
LTVDEGNSHTAWDFTDTAPTVDNTPAGYACAGIIFGDDSPCQADPLIFLRYDAGVDLNNAVTAPGAHQIHISTNHLDPTAPAVTSLTVWTSTDGGHTWTKEPSASAGDGKYIASYSVPPASDTDGAVSLKVHAIDAAGNDTTQVINDAFRLTPGQP